MAGRDSLEDSGIRLGSVGPYHIERELRRGGMGTVYLARDHAGTPVALKMALRDDPQTSARFAQEIRATRSLAHPGIVRVREDGTWSGRAWYAMDYVSAVNLADILAAHGENTPQDIGGLVQGVVSGQLQSLELDQRRGLSLSTALAVMERVIEAVSHAHARGVLHRDLKPANILLTETGDPVLADFGVARELASTLRLTADHEVVGTYTYIAPEQLAGEEIDERADVYALGAMLYECLTGRPPPRRRDGCERLRFERNVPADLRAIVYQALEPRVALRTRSAAGLGADLRRFQRGEAIQARGPRPLRVLAWRLQRNLLLASLAAAVLLVALLLLVVLLTLDDEGVEVWATAATGALEAAPLRWRDTSHATRTVGRVSLPPAQGVRLTAQLPLSADGPVGVFLGADANWQDGYRLLLEGERQLVAELWRGEQLLWLGPAPAAPGKLHVVALERVGDRLAASANGQTLVTVVDLLALTGASGGAIQPSSALGSVPAISVSSIPLPERLPRDWFPARLAAAAAQLPPERRQDLLRMASGAIDDLLRRAAPDDPRRPDWILRRGAIRAVGGADLDPAHRADLLALGQDPQSALPLHQQLLLALGADPAPEALRQQVDAASYQLERRDLELLACWIDQHLAPAARRAALSLILPRLVENAPLVARLHWRRARRALGELGDLAACRAELDAIPAEVTAGFAQRARRLAAELRFAARTAAPAELPPELASTPQAALLRWRACLLGGPWPPQGPPGSALVPALLGLEDAAVAILPAPPHASDLRQRLRPVDQAPPADGLALLASQPLLLPLALREPQEPVAAAAERLVLALRLAAAPRERVLLDWARAVLDGGGPEDLVLALAIHAAEGSAPEALIARAAGAERTLLEQLFLAPERIPTERLELARPLGPILELLAAVRCIELGALAAARDRLIALQGHAAPYRPVAARLLRELP